MGTGHRLRAGIFLLLADTFDAAEANIQGSASPITPISGLVKMRINFTEFYRKPPDNGGIHANHAPVNHSRDLAAFWLSNGHRVKMGISN